MSSIGKEAQFNLIRRSPLDILRFSSIMDVMSRLFSPYDFEPFITNPLRNILADIIHFDRLVQSPIKLFVTATNVSTGKIKVFRNKDLTPDVLLASACLPTFFEAVNIDNEYY